MMKVASTAIFAVWLIYSLVSFFSYSAFKICDVRKAFENGVRTAESIESAKTG